MRAGIRGETVHLVVYEVFSILTHLVPKATHCRWLGGGGVKNNNNNKKQEEGTRVFMSSYGFIHTVFFVHVLRHRQICSFPSLLIFTCFGSNSLSVGATYCTVGKLTSPLVVDVNGGGWQSWFVHGIASYLICLRDFTPRRYISQMIKQFYQRVSRPVLRFERPVNRIG